MPCWHCNLLHRLHLPATQSGIMETTLPLQKTREGATPGTHYLAS